MARLLLMTQCLNIYNLFDSFCRQNQRRVILNADTVFNAYSNASEMFRPPLIIRNIDPRFHGDTMASFQWY